MSNRNYTDVLTSINFLLTFLFFFTGCSAHERDLQTESLQTGTPTTASFIHKGVSLSSFGMETTPFVFNGQTYFMYSDRSSSPAIDIYDSSMQKISHQPVNFGFACALVYAGTLYVFGSSNESGWAGLGNSVEMISTSDLQNWTPAMTLFSAGPNFEIFNVSVAPDAQGFIMAYEICRLNKVCFSVQFKHSQDLIHWQDVGSLLGDGVYTACPTIRYVNGFYYVFFLGHFPGGIWATLITRSQDLFSWQQSSQTVIGPDQGDDRKNASDLDLTEANNQVLITYAVGPQTTWDQGTSNGVRTATFNGTLTDFVQSFY
jgi:hypothetical protein